LISNASQISFTMFYSASPDSANFLAASNKECSIKASCSEESSIDSIFSLGGRTLTPLIVNYPASFIFSTIMFS
jgi:hypothetical protein